MYFQYGLFKPLVIRKIGAVVRVRHTIPALLLGSIATSLLLGLWMRPFLTVFAALLVLYALAALFASAAAVRRAGAAPALVPWLCAAFATIHWAYGAGFICGVYKLVARRWHGGAPAAQWIPISR